MRARVTPALAIAVLGPALCFALDYSEWRYDPETRIPWGSNLWIGGPFWLVALLVIAGLSIPATVVALAACIASAVLSYQAIYEADSSTDPIAALFLPIYAALAVLVTFGVDALGRALVGRRRRSRRVEG